MEQIAPMARAKPGRLSWNGSFGGGMPGEAPDDKKRVLWGIRVCEQASPTADPSSLRREAGMARGKPGCMSWNGRFGRGMPGEAPGDKRRVLPGGRVFEQARTRGDPSSLHPKAGMARAKPGCMSWDGSFGRAMLGEAPDDKTRVLPGACSSKPARADPSSLRREAGTARDKPGRMSRDGGFGRAMPAREPRDKKRVLPGSACSSKPREGGPFEAVARS